MDACGRETPGAAVVSVAVVVLAVRDVTRVLMRRRPSYNGGMVRKIADADAMPLLAAYARGEELTPAQTRTAARFALEELAERHPGKSVEVRVPYVGAVQVVEGLRHRRGTPPNVVEMSATTWMDLVCGRATWTEVEGQIDASGTRSDLHHFFPLFTSAVLARW